jgi:hypothetical protein
LLLKPPLRSSSNSALDLFLHNPIIDRTVATPKANPREKPHPCRGELQTALRITTGIKASGPLIAKSVSIKDADAYR